MAEFETAARFEAPAAAIWPFVSWDGMPCLVEGGFFTAADFPAGPEIRPGALRRVSTANGVFVERLEEYRAEDHYYRYRLIDTGPFPLTDYVGVVVVTPAGSGCCLKFGHSATLVDTDAASWRESWLAIENQVFDFIRGRLA
ncbi:SRPBCC family protein [Sandaracinobacter sp. RS1-74]|uniref:SRPBCC family protein n=1 Tax=Sandaracinobacteroides sayramensis TaxID=2913411 RepID=UPI001EDA190E|nr:SRPBCC family protein [Sandaracinobacteroides sayramensis]MCG2842622.1 SRPBCC family protein [Sandaracinobacteroides sayramensis]